MREFFLSIIISSMGLMVIGNAHAADQDAAETPRVGEQQIGDVQKTDGPDKTQEEYLSRLKKINAVLRNKHSAFGKNYRLTRANRERMNSDLEWGYGELSSAMIKSLQDLEDEKVRLEAAINGLNKEKADLRADVLSFYEGKVPKWLTERWDKEEKAYRDYVERIYLKVQWSWESKSWVGDKRVFRDYMEEYYRLHPQ
ncbi:MAG TPA: hypothetical protein VFG09_10955 [Thermodesulfovibrionales bacterium]|nr:hypothetical protein [Thermodesulfovibrionales bacterium]